MKSERSTGKKSDHVRQSLEGEGGKRKDECKVPVDARKNAQVVVTDNQMEKNNWNGLHSLPETSHQVEGSRRVPTITVLIGEKLANGLN